MVTGAHKRQDQRSPEQRDILASLPEPEFFLFSLNKEQEQS
jgi:hypothetical protein